MPLEDQAAAEDAFSRDAIARALDASPMLETDLAVIVTTAGGEVAVWNKAAERLYGWRAAEALGQDVLKLTPSTQSKGRAATIMRTLQAGQAWEGEIVLRRRDGSPFRAFVVDLPVGPLAEGRGAIVGVSVAADERQRLGAARSRIEAEVRARFAADS
jgi:PAS domain S-box-containing protein